MSSMLYPESPGMLSFEGSLLLKRQDIEDKHTPNVKNEILNTKSKIVSLFLNDRKQVF